MSGKADATKPSAPGVHKRFDCGHPIFCRQKTIDATGIGKLVIGTRTCPIPQAFALRAIGRDQAPVGQFCANLVDAPWCQPKIAAAALPQAVAAIEENADLIDFLIESRKAVAPPAADPDGDAARQMAVSLRQDARIDVGCAGWPHWNSPDRPVEEYIMDIAVQHGRDTICRSVETVTPRVLVAGREIRLVDEPEIRHEGGKQPDGRCQIVAAAGVEKRGSGHGFQRPSINKAAQFDLVIHEQRKELCEQEASSTRGFMANAGGSHRTNARSTGGSLHLAQKIAVAPVFGKQIFPFQHQQQVRHGPIRVNGLEDEMQDGKEHCLAAHATVQERLEAVQQET